MMLVAMWRPFRRLTVGIAVELKRHPRGPSGSKLDIVSPLTSLVHGLIREFFQEAIALASHEQSSKSTE
jgi:hypothetical protein